MCTNVDPKDATVFHFARTILWQGLGGILLGWVGKNICKNWLTFVKNDAVNIINIMLVFAYGVFYIAESTKL